MVLAADQTVQRIKKLWEMVIPTIGRDTKDEIGKLFMQQILGMSEENVSKHITGDFLWLGKLIAVTDTVETACLESFWQEVNNLQPIHSSDLLAFLATEGGINAIYEFMDELRIKGYDSLVLRDIHVSRLTLAK